MPLRLFRQRSAQHVDELPRASDAGAKPAVENDAESEKGLDGLGHADAVDPAGAGAAAAAAAVVTEDSVPPDGGYGWVCCIVSLPFLLSLCCGYFGARSFIVGGLGGCEDERREAVTSHVRAEHASTKTPLWHVGVAFPARNLADHNALAGIGLYLHQRRDLGQSRLLRRLPFLLYQSRWIWWDAAGLFVYRWHKFCGRHVE